MLSGYPAVPRSIKSLCYWLCLETLHGLGGRAGRVPQSFSLLGMGPNVVWQGFRRLHEQAAG